jgi:hypothetical protein
MYPRQTWQSSSTILYPRQDLLLISMMDQSASLMAITVAGIGYAAYMLLAPATYASEIGAQPDADNQFLTRQLGCAIAGISTMTYMAAKSDSAEVKKIALVTGATTFALYSANNVHRSTSKCTQQNVRREEFEPTWPYPCKPEPFPQSPSRRASPAYGSSSYGFG